MRFRTALLSLACLTGTLASPAFAADAETQGRENASDDSCRSHRRSHEHRGQTTADPARDAAVGHGRHARTPRRPEPAVAAGRARQHARHLHLRLGHRARDIHRARLRHRQPDVRRRAGGKQFQHRFDRRNDRHRDVRPHRNRPRRHRPHDRRGQSRRLRSTCIASMRTARSLRLSLGFTAGSWNDYRVDADVSTPLTSDGSVRARFVGVYQDTESFQDLYNKEKTVLYGIVDADLSENTRLSVGVDFQDNKPQLQHLGLVPAVPRRRLARELGALGDHGDGLGLLGSQDHFRIRRSFSIPSRTAGRCAAR